MRTLAHSFHINHILFSARRYHPWPENFSIPEMDSLPSPGINYANNFLSPQDKSPAQVGHEAVRCEVSRSKTRQLVVIL